jgi:hypothetical protein
VTSSVTALLFDGFAERWLPPGVAVETFVFNSDSLESSQVLAPRRPPAIAWGSTDGNVKGLRRFGLPEQPINKPIIINNSGSIKTFELAITSPFAQAMAYK